MSFQCKKITNGKYITIGYEYRGYEVRNHGYYEPDQCIWWEAVDMKTGCADFHEHTKREIKNRIDEYTNHNPLLTGNKNQK